MNSGQHIPGLVVKRRWCQTNHCNTSRQADEDKTDTQFGLVRKKRPRKTQLIPELR